MYNAQIFFIIKEILLTRQKVRHVRCVIGVKVLQIAPLSRLEVRHLD